MGLAIKDIIPAQPITLQSLAGKTVAIDTYNLLYQFLTTIRSRDGSLLTNDQGTVTSHVLGLFARTTSFLQSDIKPAFVFDGPPPKLKLQELNNRREQKQQAEQQRKKAEEDEDLESMKKYAARTTRLTKEMVEEAKELITALGLPVIQAPSEGEAQAAAMAREGAVTATVSQDFDTLLYATPQLIRNLSVSGKRKKTGGATYQSISPESIRIGDVLNALGIDQQQLLHLAVLIGTDYNPGGVKGIGPKKALELVKQHPTNAVFDQVTWQHKATPQEIIDTFNNMSTVSVDLSFNPVDEAKVQSLLIDRFGFAQERVDTTLAKLTTQKRSQKGLGDFM